MGSSESKLKPEPEQQQPKNLRIAQLIDPRSPSCGIDRTPIQVSKPASCVQEVRESAEAVCVDPRSPTPGVFRTPMKVTVSALARRLSTFFLNDVPPEDTSSTFLPSVSFTKHSDLDHQGELSSKEGLLPSHDSFSGCTESSSTVVDVSSFSSSPFVLVGEAQLDVGMEVSLEEAEEAELLEESPIIKELSLSLLACREGVYSPDLYSSDKEQCPTSEEEQAGDHLYAVPCKPTEPSAPVEGAVMLSAAQPREQEEVTSEIPILPEKQNLSLPEPARASSKPSSNLHIQSEGSTPGVLPRFSTCSPSQVVFKPQWLGVGFGATGIRARGVQGREKGMSGLHSTRKPVIDENDNKVVLNKSKQRGKTLIGEGRSPLQILKETNSPRGHTAQMKLNISTPEKQKFTPIGRRGLALSNKENQ